MLFDSLIHKYRKIKLEKIINKNIDHERVCHSRAHALNSMNNVYIKRDDELGFSVNGTKLRKYLSLIKHLKDNHIDEVVAVGGAYSNNLFSLSQLLVENKIKPIFFVRGEPSQSDVGNALLTRLTVSDKNIFWMGRTSIADITNHARVFYEKRQLEHPNIFFLDEGSSCREALLGVMTLALDILKNQETLGFSFSHICIDAGSGLSAVALILALEYLKIKVKVHVLIVAGSIDAFHALYKHYQVYFYKLMKTQRDFNLEFYLYQSGSFEGKKLKNHHLICDFLAKEGVLLDPIYNNKMYEWISLFSSEVEKSEKILWIHSGGTFSISGYFKELGKIIHENLI